MATIADYSIQLDLTGGKYKLYKRILESRLGPEAALHVACVSLGIHKRLLPNSIPGGAVEEVRKAATEEGVLEIFGTAPMMRPHP